MVRRSLPLAVVLVPFFAFAQPVHQEKKDDEIRVTWESDPFADGRAPGRRTKFFGNEATSSVRLVEDLPGKVIFLVEFRTAGSVVSKRVEGKPGMVTQVWFRGALAILIAEPLSACGPESDLQSLSSAIEEESFSAGKLRTLEDALSARGVCADHAALLIKLFSFDADKVSALKLIAPRLTDPQNKFKVYKAFDFDSTRDEAKKILK